MAAAHRAGETAAMSRSGSRSRRRWSVALFAEQPRSPVARSVTGRRVPPLQAARSRCYAQPLQQSPDGLPHAWCPFSRGSLENSGLVRERETRGRTTQHSWVAITRPAAHHSAHTLPASKAGAPTSEARLDVGTQVRLAENVDSRCLRCEGRCDYKVALSGFPSEEKAAMSTRT